MFNSESLGRRTSALASKHGSGGHAVLLDEIFSQGKRRAEVLPAMRRAVLWKGGDSFQGQIGIRSGLGEPPAKHGQMPYFNGTAGSVGMQSFAVFQSTHFSDTTGYRRRQRIRCHDRIG